MSTWGDATIAAFCLALLQTFVVLRFRVYVLGVLGLLWQLLTMYSPRRSEHD